MADSQQDSLLGRLLAAIGLKSDEIAAGHGTLPETGSRPSTRSRRRTKEHQRDRAPDIEAEKAAEAIAEAADALDEQIRRSVDDPGSPQTSEEMIERAKRRWSDD